MVKTIHKHVIPSMPVKMATLLMKAVSIWRISCNYFIPLRKTQKIANPQK